MLVSRNWIRGEESGSSEYLPSGLSLRVEDRTGVRGKIVFKSQQRGQIIFTCADIQ